MSEAISILNEAGQAPYLGTGSVAELLSEVVQAELRASMIDPETVPFSEIELDPADALEGWFTVRLYESTGTEEQPARRLTYDFGLHTMRDNSAEILDKTVHTDAEQTYKLTKPQALFFAGLSWRCFVAAANRPDK